MAQYVCNRAVLSGHWTIISVNLLNSDVRLPAIKVPNFPKVFLFTFTLRTWILFEQINARINTGLALGMY